MFSRGTQYEKFFNRNSASPALIERKRERERTKIIISINSTLQYPNNLAIETLPQSPSQLPVRLTLKEVFAFHSTWEASNIMTFNSMTVVNHLKFTPQIIHIPFQSRTHQLLCHSTKTIKSSSAKRQIRGLESHPKVQSAATVELFERKQLMAEQMGLEMQLKTPLRFSTNTLFMVKYVQINIYVLEDKI